MKNIGNPDTSPRLKTIEEMEIALREFRGALIVISHDRAFLRNCGIEKSYRITDGELIEFYAD